MANNFYTASGYPAPSAPGASLNARNEFSNISAAFDKMPTLIGSALYRVRVNSAGTALESVVDNTLDATVAASTYQTIAGMSSYLTTASAAATYLGIGANAVSATKLATARAINGVNFDGTAAITVTAAAGTLTGTTLAAGVTASSLTSVGTLTSLTMGGNIALGGNQLLGTGNIGGTANNSAYSIWGGASVLDGGYIQLCGSTNGAANTIIFGTNSLTRLTIDSSGNATFAGGKLKSTASFSTGGDVASAYAALSNQTLMYVDSSRTANNKEVEWLWSSSVFQGRFVNDAYSAATNFFNITGGQALGVTAIDIFTGANAQTLRMSNQRANFSTRATDDATYQLQVTGAGQLVAAITDAGVKGGSLYLLDSASAGAGQGGALLFGGFGAATPFAGIKGFITNASGNTQGDLLFLTRNGQTDTALTERARLLASGEWGLNCAPVGSVPLRVQAPGSNDVGLEWQRTGATVGVLQSYSRAGSAYTSLILNALDLAFQISSTTKLALAATTGAATFSAGAATTTFAIGNTGGAVTVDCSKSNVQSLTLTSNLTSLTLSNLQDGQTVNLQITQDATGSRTTSASLTNANGYIWPSGVQGVLSTAPNSVDLLVLTKVGSKVLAALNKAFA